jgi:hypothetical protein
MSTKKFAFTLAAAMVVMTFTNGPGMAQQAVGSGSSMPPGIDAPVPVPGTQQFGKSCPITAFDPYVQERNLNDAWRRGFRVVWKPATPNCPGHWMPCSSLEYRQSMGIRWNAENDRLCGFSSK